MLTDKQLAKRDNLLFKGNYVEEDGCKYFEEVTVDVLKCLVSLGYADENDRYDVAVPTLGEFIGFCEKYPDFKAFGHATNNNVFVRGIWSGKPVDEEILQNIFTTFTHAEVIDPDVGYVLYC